MAKIVLLVEDDPNDSRLIGEALNEIEPELSIFFEENGLDALRYLKGELKYEDRAKYPLPDIILLDLGLPILDGYEFLEWLRNKAPHALRETPVIVITGANQTDVMSRAYLLGANAIIIKQTQWAEFKQAFRRVERFWPRPGRIS